MAVRHVMGEPILLPLLIIMATIWLLPHTHVSDRIHTRVSSQYQQLPKVKIDLHPHRTFRSRYSANRTALYIETRENIKHVTPLLVHMMEVVPPEWRFVFLGTEETTRLARTSGSARRYEEWGKLRIGRLDPWVESWGRRWDDLSIDEMNSRLLTNSSFYEVELPNVENLLVFHSDGILCANSHVDLNEWLEYDWVGAPWQNAARFGGNGGLSLRRVSKTLEVLQFQKRLDDSFSEDEWLSSRIGLLPGANMASPDVEKGFAVENIWAERPMGYHLNPAGLSGEVWEQYERRKMIYEYCPEIKIILDMRLEREKCVAPLPAMDMVEWVSEPPFLGGDVLRDFNGMYQTDFESPQGNPRQESEESSLPDHAAATMEGTDPFKSIANIAKGVMEEQAIPSEIWLPDTIPVENPTEVPPEKTPEGPSPGDIPEMDVSQSADIISYGDEQVKAEARHEHLYGVEDQTST